jgi:hypothetical protein
MCPSSEFVTEVKYYNNNNNNNNNNNKEPWRRERICLHSPQR